MDVDVNKLILPGIVLFFLARKGITRVAQQISVASGIKFSVTGAGPQGVNFQLITPILNSSNVSIPVGRFDGQLYYGSTPIAEVDLPQPTYLSAGGTTSMILTGRINFQEVWSGIEQIWKAGDITQNLKLVGKLYYGENMTLSIPIEYKVWSLQ